MKEPSSLPDRLDDALAALWGGNSDALDQLVGGADGDSPGIGQVLGVSGTTFHQARARPKEIGGFRILGELGRGGMGIVYQAQQQHPDRLVALKVIRGAELAGEDRVRLFQREVRILARLRHPDIAALYGAGRTEDGLDFFVMELISGSPLNDYLSKVAGGPPDANTLPHVLNVFGRVCDAISYAHQKGVIHRDIKPSNILVNAGSHPDHPEVKVFDFGLARAADPDAVTRTATLDAARFKGTLPYMSPEQIVGDPDEIDVRADVYSLGVVLYQLLTGRLPVDPKNRSMPEVLSAIREESVPRPASLHPLLRGDLETIILKAIEPDPTRRYQSAASLSDDLRRFLADQPIHARPASLGYLARKLVARHRLAFASGAALLVVCLAATAISVTSLVQARAAQRAADKERQVAEAVSRFLVNTFSHIDPRTARNRDTTLLRELLTDAAKRTESDLAGQPQVRSKLIGVFGQAYQSLGLYDKAEPHLVLAQSLAERSLGPEHPETLTAGNNLAVLRADQGQLEEALRLNEAVLEARRRILGNDHPDTTMSMNNLGDLYRQCDRLSDAERLLKEAVDVRRRVLGVGHHDTLVSMNNLSNVWVLQKKTRMAESLLKECLDGQRKSLPEDHPDVLVSKSDLAVVLQRNGKPAEAEVLLREAVAGFTRHFGPGHMDTLIAAYNLENLVRSRRTPGEAVAAMAELLAIAEAHLPVGHDLVGSFRSSYARRLFEAGRFAEAEAPALQSLDELEAALGPKHLNTRSTADTVADIYDALAQPERAAPYRARSERR